MSLVSVVWSGKAGGAMDGGLDVCRDVRGCRNEGGRRAETTTRKMEEGDVDVDGEVEEGGDEEVEVGLRRC